ncbi:MAG: murein L,D-transpeptidase family protein [Xanthobacteraceae bacterium]
MADLSGNFTLIRACIARALTSCAVSLRLLATSALLGTAALALAGCYGEEGYQLPTRAMKELSPEMLALLQQKNMPKDSPILIRVFKEESELEVWKQDTTSQYQLLKVYPICRWSGELGPKKTEGDRQAPEGFYAITPGLMNPNSNYYLAINIGFPNAYDKANGYSGAFLMIHGDCSSRGCYAMTDEQIGEIYSLARDSFLGGQKAFQIQAYPFRLTAANLAKHRNNPNMPFWRMIKEGYDDFEVTRQEPKVDFCEKRYVFDAEKPPNATRDPVFEASAKCPAYVIPDEVASAVRAKEQADETEMAKLIARGTPVARLNTGIDGGMNRVFAAALPNGNTGLSESGEGRSLSLVRERLPGTIPMDHVNPPRGPVTSPDEPLVASAASSTHVASAAPDSHSDGFFSRLAHKVGLGGATADATASVPPPPLSAAAKPRINEARHHEPQHPEASSSKMAPKSDTKQAAAHAPLKPSLSGNSTAPAAAANDTVAGSQPIVQANSFENRFSAAK